MDFQTLKHKQRALRESFPTDHGLRVHRALSWLHKSEQCGDDKDSQFIFFWVAFNAAYAQELEHMELSESELFGKFTQKLVDLDKQGRIYRLIWDEFRPAFVCYSTISTLSGRSGSTFPVIKLKHNGNIVLNKQRCV